MATVPSFRTWATSDVVTAAMLNSNIRDAGQFWVSNRPRALLRQTVAQNLLNNTPTAITYDVEDLDNDGGHSTSSNTSRYVAQTAGWYHVTGLVSYSTNTTGARGTRIGVNGSTVNASQSLAQTSASSAATGILATRLVFLNAADYVEIFGFQLSGGTLATNAATDGACNMSIFWLGS